MNFPVSKLIELLEPGPWEEFTEEWATSLKSYKDVERWAGPGDMGRDIVAFTTDQKYDGPWDNYQCKQYRRGVDRSQGLLECARGCVLAIRGYVDFPS